MSSVEMYRARVEELIRQADITTVSAKKIRKQIETSTNTSLANVKKEFDELVMEIYEKITDDIERAVLNGSGGQSNGSNGNISHTPYQQQHQPQHQQIHQHQTPAPAPQQTPSFGFALPPTSYVPPPPPPVVKPDPHPVASNTSEDDEDEDEDDGGDESDASFSSVEGDSERATKKAKTSSSTSSSSSKKKSSAKASKAKPKAKAKSSSGKKEPKEKVKRKTPVNEDGTPKVNNFTRPMVISPTLYEVVGHAGTIGTSGRVEMSRPEVVKQIWVYIKANNLQAETDKRMINCDPKLKSLFGQDQVSCFTMNKYLSGHLSKAEELV